MPGASIERGTLLCLTHSPVTSNMHVIRQQVLSRALHFRWRSALWAPRVMKKLWSLPDRDWTADTDGTECCTFVIVSTWVERRAHPLLRRLPISRPLLVVRLIADNATKLSFDDDGYCPIFRRQWILPYLELVLVCRR